MEQVLLAGQKRENFGSKPARRLRNSGLVPAIVYGHGMDPVSIQVSTKDLIHVLHTKAGENVVVDLKIDDAKLKETTCLIKNIQHDPVTDFIQHVDFTIISLTEKITVQVPVITLNADDAVGLKEGGVLDVIHHEIEVECLPTQIPEKFEVDIKQMKINDIVHAKELNVPDGVELSLEPDEAVITIHPPRKEEEEVPAEEGATEPEVIEKGKKPEDAEGGGDAPAGGGEKKPKAEGK